MMTTICQKCFQDVEVQDPNASILVPINHMNNDGHYCTGSGCMGLTRDQLNEQMQKHFDEESYKYMVQTDRIIYALECYFRRFAMSPKPMAMFKKDVESLNIYKKILLLETLVAERQEFERHLPRDYNGFVEEIADLLKEIDKRNFWCGDEDCIYPVSP